MDLESMIHFKIRNKYLINVEIKTKTLNTFFFSKSRFFEKLLIGKISQELLLQFA